MKDKKIFDRLDYKYKWKVLLEAPIENPEGDNVFRETEKLLYASGLHSKLIEKDGNYHLMVRLSEFEYADDLVKENVSKIISHPIEPYRLFEENIQYKNDKFLIKNTSNNTIQQQMKRNSRRSMMFMLLAIFAAVIAAAFFV